MQLVEENEILKLNIEKLKKELKESKYNDEYNKGVAINFGGIVQKHAKEIEKLKTQNKKLRECVEFYGDDSIWHDINGNGEHYLMISNDSSIDYFSEGIECGGKKARECLKELE